MKAKLLFLVFLMVFLATNVAFQIFGKVYAEEFHVLQGKYIDVKAPLYFSSDFPGKMEAELPLFNRIYEVYYDLTGLQPYDGRKITVFYDPSISEAVAYAGQIIRIGKGFWNEPNGVLIGHELGHCFTLEFDQIFPKRSSAFIEGWAQFIRQYAFWVISTDEFFPWLPAGVTYPGLYQQDLYQWFKQYEEEALSTYIQNGCKFEMIQANAWAGILQEIADEYGWNTYKRLFHLLQTDEVQRYPCPIETEDRCNLFVACLNIAARNDLTTKFMTYGFPIDRDKVHEWERKISPPGPIPDIKINGSDDPVTLSQSDTLSITVALNNNGQTDNADWWLAADTPFGLYFFTFDGWTDAWVPGYQGALFYLDSLELLRGTPSEILPTNMPGTYTLYFGVDTVMDGNVTWDSVYYDSVVVNVEEEPSSEFFTAWDGVYESLSKFTYEGAMEELLDYCENKSADLLLTTDEIEALEQIFQTTNELFTFLFKAELLYEISTVQDTVEGAQNYINEIKMSNKNGDFDGAKEIIEGNKSRVVSDLRGVADDIDTYIKDWLEGGKLKITWDLEVEGKGESSIIVTKEDLRPILSDAELKLNWFSLSAIKIELSHYGSFIIKARVEDSYGYEFDVPFTSSWSGEGTIFYSNFINYLDDIVLLSISIENLLDQNREVEVILTAEKEDAWEKGYFEDAKDFFAGMADLIEFLSDVYVTK